MELVNSDGEERAPTRQRFLRIFQIVGTRRVGRHGEFDAYKDERRYSGKNNDYIIHVYPEHAEVYEQSGIGDMIYIKRINFRN